MTTTPPVTLSLTTPLFGEIAGKIPACSRPEREIVGLCAALGAADDEDLTPDECRLLADAIAPTTGEATRIRERIAGGTDVLGELFCEVRSPEHRRLAGAVYTPSTLVNAMIGMTGDSPPGRIVDPGAGSGRFLAAAAPRFPKADLVAVECDALATLMLRANARVLGWRDRLTVIADDFTSCRLPESDGTTLWIGNPPYVRHHGIAAEAKARFARVTRDLGIVPNGLAGLHVHFLAAIAEHARKDDQGVIVTSAEWMDVRYGAVVRELLLRRLGLVRLVRIHPGAMPFGDTATTAAILAFRVGVDPDVVDVADVEDLARFHRPSRVARVSSVALGESARWSTLGRATTRPPEGFVKLGELMRVHRGQVTGANDVWVVAADFRGLPDSVLHPAVTRARELLMAGPVLDDVRALRRVIDLPEDLGELDEDARSAVMAFLASARKRGADRGYVATHRRAWWSVGLRAPAPILATYMARRPPAFVLNPHGARHINIAHGLYPRVEMSARQLEFLARHLTANADRDGGRTYAGGLVKYEPREMEGIMVPDPFREEAPGR